MGIKIYIVSVLLLWMNQAICCFGVNPEGGLKMAVRMADSGINQFPGPTAVDFVLARRWNYSPGPELWENKPNLNKYDKRVEQNSETPMA